MLRFFRQIRQKLIEKENMRKYFWYALGEIFLVMIGILLALQINIWNENRKTREQADAYLRNVQSDLITDINQTNIAKYFYTENDSLFHIIKDIRDPEMILQNPELEEALFITMSYVRLAVQERGINQLTGLSSDLPKSYNDLIDELSEFYKFNSDNVEFVSSEFLRTITEEYEDLRNRDWFADFMDTRLDYRTTNITSEFVEYALNDPLRRNRLYTYNQHIRGDFRRVLAFNVRAKIIYMHIGEFLGETDYPEQIDIRKITDDEEVEFLTYTWRSERGDELHPIQKNEDGFLGD